jgi:prolyl oligopeptidase
MKFLLLLTCLAFGLAACSGPGIPRTSARPPASRIEPVTDRLHGRTVVDNYRWLEGDNSNSSEQGKVTPEVASWTDQQNAYTRQVLDNLPGRKALEDRLRPLMEVGSVTAPTVRGNRYFFSRREGSQNQPVIYWREGYKGADRVLIDPAKLDATGLTTVEWISPSNDGKLLAYGTYRAGDENTTLNLLQVDTGEKLPLEIPDKTRPPDWLPDDSGFVYQNLKNPKDPYSGQVLFHRMGTERTADQLLFRQFTASENLLGRHEIERPLARGLQRRETKRQGRPAAGLGWPTRHGLGHRYWGDAVSTHDQRRPEGPRRRGACRHSGRLALA